ncbi:MAG: hypothetical protein HY328_15185 [Chloroflexi bacterium]|nr:hypothetical protein [Chloroflexota bacterium]
MRADTAPSGEQRFSLLETIREFALEQLRHLPRPGTIDFSTKIPQPAHSHQSGSL